MNTSALAKAIEKNDILEVNRILRSNPDLAHAKVGNIPIIIRSFDNPLILSSFLEHIPANTKLFPNEGLLMYAVRKRNFDAVRVLLDFDADPNREDLGLPLQYAVEHNLKDYVDLLLDYGASPEIGTVEEICRDKRAACEPIVRKFHISPQQGYTGMDGTMEPQHPHYEEFSDLEESATPDLSDSD